MQMHPLFVAAQVQREIQLEKGYTPEHDAEHRFGELTQAAASFLGVGVPYPWSDFDGNVIPGINLAKAVALLMAEWDRLEARNG